MPSVVFFHAHPDDEVLLTGGTIAALADAGWQVTIVTATDGCMTETPPSGPPRVMEVREAAAVLGVAHAATLGYADSGKGPVLYPDPADRQRFVRAELDETAHRLASILREADAGVLVHYDAAGAYHHPDHVRTHQVGARAAELAGTEVVLEATVPRERMARARLLLGWLPAFPYTREQVAGGGTPAGDIDLSVDVGRWVDVKTRALACHTSVVGARTASGRMTASLLALPPWLQRGLVGREWFRTTRGRGASPWRELRRGVTASGADGAAQPAEPARGQRVEVERVGVVSGSR